MGATSSEIETSYPENTKDNIGVAEPSQKLDNNFPPHISVPDENILKSLPESCPDEKTKADKEMSGFASCIAAENPHGLPNNSGLYSYRDLLEQKTGSLDNSLDANITPIAICGSLKRDPIPEPIDSPHELLQSTSVADKSPHNPEKSDLADSKSCSDISELPPSLKRCLGLLQTHMHLEPTKNDQLFVISTDHIVGYVESLEAAKLWIEDEISRAIKNSSSPNFEIKRDECISQDNVVYNVTVYERNVNLLLSRPVIFLQYNVWQAPRLYSENY
jgi:hypothetical protein